MHYSKLLMRYMINFSPLGKAYYAGRLFKIDRVYRE